MSTHILFDFDGVIVDSFALTFKCAKMGRPWITEEEYRANFLGNIYEMFEAENTRRPAIRSDDDFFVSYRELLANIAPVPGMREIIIDLAARHTLSIVTSCYDAVINEFLEKHDLRQHFGDVLGAQIDRSKVNKMNMLLAKYNLAATDFLFITDTVGDIHEAAHVGIPAVGVTWGVHSRVQLEAANPLRIIDYPNELMEL